MKETYKGLEGFIYIPLPLTNADKLPFDSLCRNDLVRQIIKNFGHANDLTQTV